jgi:SET domain-containing protein
MFRDRKKDKEGIFLPPIEIKEHPQKGYICIAAEDINPGELIERCLTITFSPDLIKDIQETLEGRTIFHDYWFTKTRRGNAHLAMGYGGIYSHSENPNARWTITYHPNQRATVDIRAIKFISKGEEIAYRYVTKGDEDLLWFDSVE